MEFILLCGQALIGVFTVVVIAITLKATKEYLFGRKKNNE